MDRTWPKMLVLALAVVCITATFVFSGTRGVTGNAGEGAGSTERGTVDCMPNTGTDTMPCVPRFGSRGMGKTESQGEKSTGKTESQGEKSTGKTESQGEKSTGKTESPNTPESNR